MKIIRKKPKEAPEVIDVENTLEALQAQVGGNIQQITIAEDLVILVDEEGKLKGKPIEETFALRGPILNGTVLIVGVDGEEFCDTPHVDWLLWDLFRTVRYHRIDRKHNVWQCRKCDHIEKFEADGPYENGWNICPVCGGTILTPGNGIT
jgi:hypothetical protein